MELPKKEHIFNFDFTAETGKKYDGRFTCKCALAIGDKHAVELEKTRLQGNYTNPTDILAGIAQVIANLRVRIIVKDAPTWWEQSNGGMLIDDEDALMALYDKVMEGDRLWREKLNQKAVEAQEADLKPPTV
jgi:hypothetical protein